MHRWVDPILDMDRYDLEYEGKEIVVMLNSTTLVGGTCFAYLQLKISSFYELSEEHIAKRKSFRPEDFGIVLAIGLGAPSPELQYRMAVLYNMSPVVDP